MSDTCGQTKSAGDGLPFCFGAQLKRRPPLSKTKAPSSRPAVGISLRIHPYPCKMPHNNNSLRCGCSRPRTSWSVEIPHISVLSPSAMSHSAALEQAGFYQLEQEGRKMRGGVEECSSTVMLRHHHTSHCPFEWSCFPPDSPPVPTN